MRLKARRQFLSHVVVQIVENMIELVFFEPAHSVSKLDFDELPRRPILLGSPSRRHPVVGPFAEGNFGEDLNVVIGAIVVADFFLVHQIEGAVRSSADFFFEPNQILLCEDAVAVLDFVDAHVKKYRNHARPILKQSSSVVFVSVQFEQTAQKRVLDLNSRNFAIWGYNAYFFRVFVAKPLHLFMKVCQIKLFYIRLWPCFSKLPISTQVRLFQENRVTFHFLQRLHLPATRRMRIARNSVVSGFHAHLFIINLFRSIDSRKLASRNAQESMA